uniref:Uncharacterized protein n=1 Tax=Lotharella vacuolata TaxID=74820 RepID=A0A0H5BHC4_9EUKA|nr:hypothetical protein [Lotharella vacuolata]
MSYLICYPASKWVLYYVIKEILLKYRTKTYLKISIYIYKKWMKEISDLRVYDNNSKMIFSYNFNIFMKSKYRTIRKKSYSSDTEYEKETLEFGGIKSHFQINFLKNLKQRILCKSYLLAKFSKIKRYKKYWTFELLYGIFTIRNQEYIFNKGKAKFSF